MIMLIDVYKVDQILQSHVARLILHIYEHLLAKNHFYL